MRNQTILTKTVIVPAHKLHIYYEYIEKQLKKLERKNYSSDIGFIYEIKELLKVENYRVVKNNFSGCIVYKVTFIVDHCNPLAGEYIDCTIAQTNNIILATNRPLKIIIINEPTLSDLQQGDKVTVQILVTEVNHGADCIKVVGKFVSKK